jgi:WhiB family transcriptional regulator, redox-sensing transcriptional regulator
MPSTTPSDAALGLLTTPGSWQDAAACRDADPELFFATDETSRHDALTMCSTCPVRMECLEHALTNREVYGVWGGTDENERKRLSRRRRRAA